MRLIVSIFVGLVHRTASAFSGVRRLLSIEVHGCSGGLQQYHRALGGVRTSPSRAET